LLRRRLAWIQISLLQKKGYNFAPRISDFIASLSLSLSLMTLVVVVGGGGISSIIISTGLHFPQFHRETFSFKSLIAPLAPIF